MVGIVIVSHSKALADSLLLMAQKVTDKEVPIAAAGGIDDEENPFGTDPMRILEAIQDVYSDDGVIVFMDLGSAILSTEMAVDFLDEDEKKNVRLSAAPIVEGVASAVVQSGAGLSLDDVMKESDSALLPKQSQLTQQSESETPDEEEPETESEQSERATFTLGNALGIHARPASKIVGVMSDLDALLKIRNLSKKGSFVNGKSLNSLIMLDARKGDEVELELRGPESKEALAKLSSMFDENFGEPSEQPSTKKKEKKEPESPAVGEMGELKGVVISGGIAIGQAQKIKSELPEIEKVETDDSEQEIDRLQSAISKSKEQIRELIEGHRSTLSKDEIDIFEAQIVLLDDPDLLESATAEIRESSTTAEYGWRETVAGLLHQFEKNIAEEVRARGNDLLDVGIRVLRNLSGESISLLTDDGPSILLADQLNPSDVSSFKNENILAICTAKGTATSHSAILSRNLGIPVIFGIGENLHSVPDGKEIAVDGAHGKVYTDPSRSLLNELKERKDQWEKMKETAEEKKSERVILENGEGVDVLANISGPDDASRAVVDGAEGSGLFRTEFLYMNRSDPPTENEQFEIYSSVAKTFGDRPVAVRTADIGGDKPVPYLGIEPEMNPFLGWRGIRYSLDEPELFKTQIRAVLRASVFGNLSVMLPMISTVSEVIQAKNLINECKGELSSEKMEFDPELKIGVMIEVPAAAISLEKILQHVDYISIGTNDLTQYIMAADRNNGRVSDLGSYYQPAVLKTIGEIISTANRRSVPVSVCGEMAGDKRLTSILLVMGLRRFSISSSEIPVFKHHLRRVDLKSAKELLESLHECDDIHELKRLLSSAQV